MISVNKYVRILSTSVNCYMNTYDSNVLIIEWIKARQSSFNLLLLSFLVTFDYTNGTEKWKAYVIIIFSYFRRETIYLVLSKLHNLMRIFNEGVMFIKNTWCPPGLKFPSKNVFASMSFPIVPSKVPSSPFSKDFFDKWHASLLPLRYLMKYLAHQLYKFPAHEYVAIVSVLF